MTFDDWWLKKQGYNSRCSLISAQAWAASRTAALSEVEKIINDRLSVLRDKLGILDGRILSKNEMFIHTKYCEVRDLLSAINKLKGE